MPEFPDSMTLGEARAKLREKARDGHECPTCRQFVKVYRRRINTGQLKALIRMWKTAGTDWVKVSDLGLPGGDVAKLRYWGLICQQEGEREDGSKRTGVWRVTGLGVDFLQGRAQVREYAIVYDNKLIRLDGEVIGVRQVLGNDFDYRQLMADTAPSFEDLFGDAA